MHHVVGVCMQGYAEENSWFISGIHWGSLYNSKHTYKRIHRRVDLQSVRLRGLRKQTSVFCLFCSADVDIAFFIVYVYHQQGDRALSSRIVICIYLTCYYPAFQIPLTNTFDLQNGLFINGCMFKLYLSCGMSNLHSSASALQLKQNNRFENLQQHHGRSDDIHQGAERHQIQMFIYAFYVKCSLYTKTSIFRFLPQ